MVKGNKITTNSPGTSLYYWKGSKIGITKVENACSMGNDLVMAYSLIYSPPWTKWKKKTM